MSFLDVADKGLTLKGRAAVVYYRLRRLVVRPAAYYERCIMGYPVGEHVRCPRRVHGDALWCRKHGRWT